jgi:hypothetical protein
MTIRNAIPAILTIAAISGAAQIASAAPQTWTVLDYGKGKCVPGASEPAMMRSPATAHNALRAGGMVDNVNVVRDDNGKPTMVGVSFDDHGTTTELDFFTTPELCAAALAIATDKGATLPPDVN